MRNLFVWRLLAASGLSMLLAGPGQTQPENGAHPMLTRLEAGQWELRGGSGNARIGAICLGNPILLTQPRHRAAACTRDVVAADADSMTVNYSCPGQGRGRTTLRFETPRLVQIDSQGLDRGMPFALRAEARRVGPCA
ncbi:MAG TPA: hypothetical protein VEC11_16265 [Allosphingosinicella sp.]|nr:hypothetical protein [Allosphingosinicella sp.]